MPSLDDTRLTLERYAAAWLKGDLPTLTALYGDDIVFTYLGNNGLTGRHEGKPRALAALAEFTRRTGRRLASVTDVMAGPNLGALVVRETMGPDAAPVTRVLVYTVSGGQMRTCTVYDENPALVDRLVGNSPLGA
jgi:ketosteroid isomerase-like protein